MPRIRLLFAAPCAATLALLMLSGHESRATEQKPIWLAIGPAEANDALTPLAEKRRADGFETIISNKTVEEALASLSRRPDYLLLVGDDGPGVEKSAWRLPAKCKKLYRWRQVQAEEFVSDMAWGDLDGDDVPDVPVGRIPASGAIQLKWFVRKILAFESRPPSVADLQMAVWLGSPEYNAAVNAVASGLGVSTLQNGGPPWLQPWLIAGTENDPYCGWPPDQPASFTRQIKRGGVAGILMGHACADGFFSMRFGGGQVWYTAADAAKGLNAGPPAPPVFFFSCDSGSFARPTPCETEALLWMPGGPVATIGATTESHPLTNYFSGVCLLKAFGGRERRLGRLWLSAQLEARTSHNYLVEMLLRDAEGSLEPEINQEKLRRDQVLMYGLLGDPATRLPLPEPLEASVTRTVTGWHWTAAKPSGAAHLEVGYRPLQPSAVEWKGTHAGKEAARQAFEAANGRFVFAPIPSPPDDGPWEGDVDRPGRIRLVATGGGALYCVVLKLAP